MANGKRRSPRKPEIALPFAGVKGEPLHLRQGNGSPTPLRFGKQVPMMPRSFGDKQIQMKEASGQPKRPQMPMDKRGLGAEKRPQDLRLSKQRPQMPKAGIKSEERPKREIFADSEAELRLKSSQDTERKPRAQKVPQPKLKLSPLREMEMRLDRMPIAQRKGRSQKIARAQRSLRPEREARSERKVISGPKPRPERAPRPERKPRAEKVIDTDRVLESRSERMSRDGRKPRSVRAPRSTSEDRRPERSARPARGDRPLRGDRPERSERPKRERSTEGVLAKRLERRQSSSIKPRSVRAPRSPRKSSERGDRPTRPERADRPDRKERSERKLDTAKILSSRQKRMGDESRKPRTVRTPRSMSRNRPERASRPERDTEELLSSRMDRMSGPRPVRKARSGRKDASKPRVRPVRKISTDKVLESRIERMRGVERKARPDKAERPDRKRSPMRMPLTERALSLRVKGSQDAQLKRRAMNDRRSDEISTTRSRDQKIAPVRMNRLVDSKLPSIERMTKGLPKKAPSKAPMGMKNFSKKSLGIKSGPKQRLPISKRGPAPIHPKRSNDPKRRW